MDLVANLKNQTIGDQNAFQHMCDLVEDMIDPKSEFQSYQQLEILSDFLKKNNFQDKPYQSQNKQTQINHDQLAKLKSIMTQTTTKNNYQVQNFYNESKVYEQVNIFLGEDESYKISQSIKKLAQKEKVTQLKFWGKIYCTQKDYYVAQGLVSSQYKDKYSQDIEPLGQGVNKYTFWVTHNVLEAWQELPILTPQQVIASKNLKVLFSGDLNREITCYPEFPGQEKHLLKAQLVRITHSAQIDMYKTVDDNPKEIEINEEFKFPEYSELSNLENWVHLNPNILNAGRVTHFIDPSLPDEEKEAKQAQLTEGDPELERLMAIAAEKTIEGVDSNYFVKTFGSGQQITQITGEGQAYPYQILMIKNLLWSGMYTIAKQGFFSNIYLGYGFKTGVPSSLPLQPSEIQQDPQDQKYQFYLREMDEPNPSKPVAQQENQENQEGEEEKKDEDQEQEAQE